MTLPLLVAAAKTVAALHVDGAIDVDGVLEEATWQAAAWVDDFAQKEPREGAPPTERTEVAIAFDGDALYVAARMELRDPSVLDRPVTRRDETTGAERFIVSFDPYRSRRTAYSFAVTAGGVRADWIHTDDDERERDMSWNPVWQAAVSLGGDRWTAEMRIPLSQLRFPDDAAPVWGINFNRYVPRTGEDDFWIVVPKNVTAWSSYFGELRGLDGAEQGARVELLPYAAASMAAPGDDIEGTAGLDAKVGIGPSLTLDATVNPDFGQVEADPAVVVLDAYEVQFEERRPFFVEGAQIFRSAARTYFYSRRIGAGVRIYGATKLTGRVGARTNLGALAAVTEAGDGVPLAAWAVVRGERELDDGGVAGVIVTERAHADGSATTGGADVALRPANGQYEIAFSAGGSVVTDLRERIAAIQTSPTHYFQRPDADHLELDPTATSIAGWHADAFATKRAGTWRFETSLGAESPGLELNDVGILQSADNLRGSAGVGYFVTEPTRWLHGWALTVEHAEQSTFGWEVAPSYTHVGWEGVLPGFYGFGIGGGVNRPGLDDASTRGGPLRGTGWNADLGVSLHSSNAGAIDWGFDLGAATGQEVTGVEAGATVLWRAMDRLRFQVAPHLRAGTYWAQYVATVEGTAGGAETFGNRYVFGALALREVSVQLRSQMAITPDLTIDVYVEPFASSGRYDRLGELPRPRARERREYADPRRDDGMVSVDDGGDLFTFAEPDFTVLSLRSTVVLRCEVLPGSLLYVVWQHAGAGLEARARRLGGDILGDVFAAEAEDVFAVKMSYWWSP